MLVPRIGDCAFINMLSYVMDGGPQPRFESGAVGARLEIIATRWLPDQPIPEDIRTRAVSYFESSSAYHQWLSADHSIFEPNLSDLSPEFSDMPDSEYVLRRFQASRKVGVHSGIIVPISARGVILGTAAILRARRPRSAPRTCRWSRT